MNVLFTSDSHLGHKNIHKFREGVSSPEDNTEKFFKEAKRKINKRTLTYYLGDVAFDEEHMTMIGELPGRKILIKGNHDDMVSTKIQMEIFEEIHGCIKYKEFFLSHCPIHPQQLFRGTNVHGHVHQLTVKDRWGRKDKSYVNICPEEQGQYFTSLQELRALKQ